MSRGKEQRQSRVPAISVIQELKLVKVGKVSEKATRYTTPRLVFDACSTMATLDREHFVVLHTDGKNRIIARETVSIGSLNQAIVHPREVFKAAIHNGSAAIICVHNHPSGDPAPSSEDFTITQRLIEAGKIIGINVLDHVIIGQNDFFSFVEQGNLSSGTVSPTPSPEERLKVLGGELLRLLRRDAKMTQKRLSEVTGFCQSRLSLIENGHRRTSEGEARKFGALFGFNYKAFQPSLSVPVQKSTTTA